MGSELRRTFDLELPMARKCSGTEVDCSGAQQSLLDDNNEDAIRRLHKASIHIDEVLKENQKKMLRSNSNTHEQNVNSNEIIINEYQEDPRLS